MNLKIISSSLVILLGSFLSAVNAQDSETLEYNKKKMSILMPMLQRFKDNVDGEEVEVERAVLAKMLIELGYSDEMHVSLKPSPCEECSHDELGSILEKALASSFGDVSGARLKVQMNKPYSEKNKNSIVAPLAVALGASLEGKNMKPGLTVMARIKYDDRLAKPRYVWQQLKGLLKSTKPHRVLVSSDSEDVFKQLVGMRKLEFFVLNEVVAVARVKSAVKASFVGGDQDLYKASQLFESIQEVAKNKKIKLLVFNKAVRGRLKEVLRLCPNHLSAKMLLLAGEAKGVRPEHISQEYARIEIQPILELLNPLLEKEETYEMDLTTLKALSESVPSAALETRKIVSPKIRHLCDLLAKDVKIGINSWARSIRQPETEYRRKNTKIQQKKIRKIVNEIKAELKGKPEDGDKSEGPEEKDKTNDVFEDEDN